MLQKFYIEKGKQIEFLNSYLLVHWHRLICANNTKKTIPETNQIGVHQVSLIMRMTPAKKRGKASLCNAFTSWFSWNTKELLPTKSTSRTYADSIFQISTFKLDWESKERSNSPFSRSEIGKEPSSPLLIDLGNSF